jgi:hypothetical protein
MSVMSSETRSWLGPSTSTKGKRLIKMQQLLLCKRESGHQMPAPIVKQILLLLVKLKLLLSVLKLRRLPQKLSMSDLRSCVKMLILKCLLKMDSPSLTTYYVHRLTAHRFSLTQIIITKFNRWYGINKCISDDFSRFLNISPCE